MEPAAAKVEDKVLQRLLPRCRPVRDGPAQVLVELSWTRRNNRTRVEIEQGKAEPEGRESRARRGVAYVLHLRAEEIATHRLIANAAAEQVLRRARKPADEPGLEEGLAALLAESGKTSPKPGS